jgi:hypothetical protein
MNSTVDQYRIYLQDVTASTLALDDKDFDTGKQTKEGEYRLTDEAYGKLLDRLASSSLVDVPLELQLNILAFYQDPNGPISTKRNPSTGTER